MRRLICLLILLVSAICRAEPAKIFEDTISGRTYYHLLFTLTPTNSSLTIPSAYTNLYSRIDTLGRFDESGIFEVFIKASYFPVPSPGCNGGWIILRMTATDYDDPYSDEKIGAKRDLWNRLQKMFNTGTDSVEVAIELNPYVHVIDPSGPKLELDYCNVFFREAHREYIPYVGALKHTNDFPIEKLPTVWPVTGDGGWPQGTNSYLMLRHWFYRGSRKPLGIDADTATIKKAILVDMTGSNNPSVGEIRWLSPTLVMATAGWYSSPMAAGSYYYILEKNESGWKIIAHYLIAIS